MDWNQIVADAWRTFRNKTYLSKSALAQMALVQACVLAGDESTSLRFGVRAVLLWALMQVEGTGQKRYLRQAKVLRLRYVEGLTVGEVMARLNSPESTIKSQQRAGIKATADVLAQETGQGIGWYRPKSIELRITSCTLAELTLLRFLAVFRRAVPLQVTVSAEEIIFQPHTRTLQQANLLLQTVDGLDLHSEVRSIVTGLTPPQILLDNHNIAARFYEREQSIGAAIYHWQQAGEQTVAAQSLLAQATQLGTDEVLTLLDNFNRPKLPRDEWARLQLLHGQMIEHSQRADRSLDAAIEVYEDALSADAPLIQAEACYRLARAYQLCDMQTALTHYASAEQLLIMQTTEVGRQLLANVYISRGWIYIDQLADKELARRELESAEKHLSLNEDDTWLQLRSDWHNAWGNFFLSHRQMEQSQVSLRQAWLLARRAGDVARTIKVGYNLGRGYLHMGLFPEAYRFLLESQGLAHETGDQRMVALCNKTLGAYHIWNGEQYATALPLYQLAYDHFKQSGNTFWLASTCYDLAEVLILLGRMEAALLFLEEGEPLVEAETELGTAFQQLRGRFSELLAELTSRQRDILHYARTHNGINKRICSGLLNISERQSLREINVLVKRGLLGRTGGGRATNYVA
ncbi:MAG: sigma factor-like helix-turn-helix DNA-binding protein [Candidatus Promineifilaceae bacterium]